MRSVAFIVFFTFALSCANPSAIAHSFINEAIIAELTADANWTEANVDWYFFTPTHERSDPGYYSDSERQEMLNLMDNRCQYNISYHGNKCTVVADFSESGVAEWKERRKYHNYSPQRVRHWRESYRNIVVHFIYSRNRWWYVPVVDGSWPSPQFFDDMGDE
jgi:hypothetical protein